MRALTQEWVDKAEGDFRYPGELATKEEAHTAVKAMQAVRAFIRQKLGLADQPV